MSPTPEPLQSVDEVIALYDRWGHQHYDDRVSQLDHALQCEALARDDGVVCERVHGCGHLRALGAVTIPTTAEYHDEPRRFEFPYA